MRRPKQTSLRLWLGLLLSTSAIVSAVSIASVRAGSELSAVEEERVWSRKFLEAKTRLRELREEHDRLSSKLRVLRSSSCGGGEDAGIYHNPYLISKTGKQFERTLKELETAEQALADLQESLRRSGKPLSWRDSKLAIEQPEEFGFGCSSGEGQALLAQAAFNHRQAIPLSDRAVKSRVV